MNKSTNIPAISIEIIVRINLLIELEVSKW